MEVSITSETKFINGNTPDPLSFAIAELLGDKAEAEKVIREIMVDLQRKYPFAGVNLSMQAILEDGRVIDAHVEIKISI